MAVEYSVGGLAIDLKINGVDTAMSQIQNLRKEISGKGVSSGSSGGSNSNKSFMQMFNIGKLHYFVNMSKQYTRILSGMLQNAIDYNETLNLWQVAMRGNIDLAEQFINKMSRAYGISEETLMRYQAVFKNMLSALGDLDDNVSTKLSEVMLARAIDFASLYNVTNERAFTVFQAVLSGQVRPIRSISGYDITENTIFDIYQRAGGEKTVRQLSQIEKRLLRIYAIFGQMDTTGATGDWAKQIEEPANQLRILGEQFKELGQWIGQLFLNVLAPVLPKLNAFVMTIKEITKALAVMAGYTTPNHLEGFTESINETDEAIESLTGKLFSFDKFDVAGSGASSNILGIDPTVQSLLDSMNTSISDITMKATELSQKWLAMIGIIYDVETGTYKVGDALKNSNFVQFFKNIETILQVIKIALNWLDEKLQKIGGLSKFLWISVEVGLTMMTSGIYLVIKHLDDIILWVKNATQSIGKFSTKLWQDLVYAFTQVGIFFSNLWKGIANGFASMINWIANGFISLVNIAIDVINTIIKPIDLLAGLFGGKVQIGSWDAQVNWQPYPTYAGGGFVKTGQTFIARESGPEYVGSFGNKTAVANNDQIVSGIAGGVSNAIQPLVTIVRAIYSTMQSGGSVEVILDGQKMSNGLTPYIKGNLAREGVLLNGK